MIECAIGDLGFFIELFDQPVQCSYTQTLGHPNVHYLNLMNNDIGDEGARAIGELLKENKGIVEMVSNFESLDQIFSLP